MHLSSDLHHVIFCLYRSRCLQPPPCQLSGAGRHGNTQGRGETVAARTTKTDSLSIKAVNVEDPHLLDDGAFT